MYIVHIDIRNFRGIKRLAWLPAAGVNCLVGPGDTTKTTILDAIELALNPRWYPFADDSDFFDLDVEQTIKITVTLAGLPADFKADDQYGLHLRGWDAQQGTLKDEPGEGLEDALSLRLVIDASLEARWSIFNDRVGEDNEDAPGIRYRHARQLATTRLGPYAERHLGWGRQSVLARLGEGSDTLSMQLAQANRAAREAFRQGNRDVFKEIVARAEALSRQFSVPVRDKYAAELDVQGVTITAGGIALHDGRLPLRRLGTGSSRLVVSALQHDAGATHVALIDEVEHGLEPHRIARLLKYLTTPAPTGAKPSPQIFMTTHSPVVIRELSARDIFTVRSNEGTTSVLSVADTAKDTETAQRHLRRCPDAFLARKIVVGEGRTEHGFARGLDACWCQKGMESFALRGVAAIDGGGAANAVMIAEHLTDLGYKVFVLLDSDEPADAAAVARLKGKGAVVHEWPDACCIEERIFLDVLGAPMHALITFASECVGATSVRDSIDHSFEAAGIRGSGTPSLRAVMHGANARRALGKTAKTKGWYKDIARGERLAEIVMAESDSIRDRPLMIGISALRRWIDA
jgi:putative ATP-dependent endonuclease of the OLD family